MKTFITLIALVGLVGWTSTASAASLKDTRDSMTHMRRVVDSNWTRAQVLRQVQDRSCKQIGGDYDILDCTTGKGSNYRNSEVFVFSDGRLTAMQRSYTAVGWKWDGCDEMRGNLEALYGPPTHGSTGDVWTFPRFKYRYFKVEEANGALCSIGVWKTK